MGNIYSNNQNKYSTVDEPEPITPVDQLIGSRGESLRDRDQRQQKFTFGKDDSQSIIITDESYGVGETPVLIKSRHHIMALVDPRSPTQEISRTPISLQEEQTRREAAMSRLAKLKENSTPRLGSNNSNVLRASEFFDPRSPTQEIDRTPIRYANDKTKVPKRNIQ